MHFLSCAGEFNHHGKYMCDELYNLLREDFKRITTKNVSYDRIALGYPNYVDVKYNNVILDADKSRIRDIIKWADVVDYGGAPESYLKEAVSQNKTVFIRIERLFKEGAWKIFIPHIFLRYYRKYIKYKNNPNVYFLCVSAYAAKDLSKIGIKGERVIQWAYCPEFISVDISEKRVDNIINIVWCGRMIQWKHPAEAVLIAKELKKMNCNFHLKMVGIGSETDNLREMIDEYHLEDCIELCGALNADTVREVMKDSDVFLTTSDQNEGWGVVINEAMNSGCVVFASEQMGAAPVLIKDGENGFLIKLHHEKEIAQKIIDIVNDKEKMRRIQQNAYVTIRDCYSPKCYADTFVEMAKEAQEGHIKERKGLGEKALIR